MQCATSLRKAVAVQKIGPAQSPPCDAPLRWADPVHERASLEDAHSVTHRMLRDGWLVQNSSNRMAPLIVGHRRGSGRKAAVLLLGHPPISGLRPRPLTRGVRDLYCVARVFCPRRGAANSTRLFRSEHDTWASFSERVRLQRLHPLTSLPLSPILRPNPDGPSLRAAALHMGPVLERRGKPGRQGGHRPPALCARGRVTVLENCFSIRILRLGAAAASS